jgi:hypothetical protein
MLALPAAEYPFNQIFKNKNHLKILLLGSKAILRCRIPISKWLSRD